MNVGTGQPIARRVTRAESYVSRLIGLLGRRGLADDEGLWLEPCDSIHTFFMRFPIDVAFVDRHGFVIRCIERLRPWRATRLYAKARACIELAAGTLAAAGVREGSRLALVMAAASPSPQSGPSNGAPAS